MAKVVLATLGSLGDLHPFVAIGMVLARRGHEPLLAVPADHLAKVRAAGLAGVAVLPSFAGLVRGLGMAEQDVVARVLRDQRFLLDRLLLAHLDDTAVALGAACEGAAALVSSGPGQCRFSRRRPETWRSKRAWRQMYAFPADDSREENRATPGHDAAQVRKVGSDPEPA